MVKIPPKKRVVSQPQPPYPDPAANPAKEENEDRKVDLASLPQYGEARGQANAPVFRRKPPTPMEYLEQVYSGDIWDEVMKPTRKPRVTQSNSNNSGIPAIYVVSFTRRDGAHGGHDPETGIVGTYTTAQAANIQVMTFLNNEFPDLTRRMREASGRKYVKKSPKFEKDGLSYWIDKDNCLQLLGQKKFAYYNVFACRQEVRTDGCRGPYSLKGELLETLTQEEKALQEHVVSGFRRAM
ncbi:hypothetical protein F4805DRAFT_37603 [Annulohypoxylon moriforme]|nr:hypothetical protein F4805DRAFT_37603 [Annulohypoxylon moriforme]